MKRGQVALEFLTTYGWAFLVILIMISALAYFGVLKPSRLLPDRCNFGAELECRDFQIAHGSTGTDGTIKMKLKNNVGEVITIESMTATTESATDIACTGPTQISGVWASGDLRDFTFTSCKTDAVGFVIGEKGKTLITLRYYAVRSGSEYFHDVSGEIFATIT